jgi:hypothetical protein
MRSSLPRILQPTNLTHLRQSVINEHITSLPYIRNLCPMKLMVAMRSVAVASIACVILVGKNGNSRRYTTLYY